MRNQSYSGLPSLAVAQNATSPNPGYRSLGWSTTLNKLVVFNGSNWQQVVQDSGWGDAYMMPAPTGVAATDQAALNAACTSGKRTVVFTYAGTYLMNANITLPSAIAFVSILARGDVKIKAADTASMAWMFSSSGQVESYGIEWDCNYVPRNIACGIFDIYASSATGHRFINNSFLNVGDTDGGKAAIALTASTGYITDAVIERNTFNYSRRQFIKLGNCTGISIRDNRFIGYNKSGAASSPAILITGSNDGRFSSGVIQSNYFEPQNDSGSFAIESVCENASEFLNSFRVQGNEFNGGTGHFAGIGISGSFSHSQFIGNRFIRGVANHLCGFEIAGSRNVISGNSFAFERSTAYTGTATGVILVAPHTQAGLGDGNIIDSNTIRIAQTGTWTGGNQIAGITAYAQRDLRITNNVLEFDCANAAVLGIDLGFLENGPIDGGVICNNSIRTPGSKTVHQVGITLRCGLGTGSWALATRARNVHIYGNTIEGFDIGYTWPSGPNDTASGIYNNLIVNCNAPFATWASLPHSSCWYSLQFPPGIPQKFTVGNGTATQFDLTHNLYTRNLDVRVRRVSTGVYYKDSEITITAISNTQVRVVFTTAPTTNDAVVQVLGNG
jgi:hypothetical protein